IAVLRSRAAGTPLAVGAAAHLDTPGTDRQVSQPDRRLAMRPIAILRRHDSDGSVRGVNETNLAASVQEGVVLAHDRRPDGERLLPAPAEFDAVESVVARRHDEIGRPGGNLELPTQPGRTHFDPAALPGSEARLLERRAADVARVVDRHVRLR